MSNVNGGTITVKVSGQDVGLSDLLARLNTQMNAGMGTIRNYNTTLAALDPTTKAVQAEQIRFAQAMAAVAAKSGDTAGGIRILGQALTQVNTQTQAAQQGLGQMQGLLNTQAAAADKAKFSFGGVAQGLQTLIGGYLVATRIIGEFGKVIGEGNELEKTLTTFKVLSGSAQEYQANLALAKQQQALFGGSLNDTVGGMSEFANLSHRTGIEVTKLTNLARALATVDPAQGFKGASIALKEFFSGDNTTSLSRRFEIPKDVLNNIIKITDKKEQFTQLTAALNEFGISQELVGAQAGTTAAQYDKLSGSIADARAAIGQFLAIAAAPAASKLTEFAQAAATGFDALRTKSESLQGITARIFEVTGSFDAFNAKVQQTNDQIGAGDPVFAAFAAKIKSLSPAQYEFITALTATGTSAAEAFSKLETGTTSFDKLNEAVKFSGIAARDGQAAQDAFAVALGNAATAGANGIAYAAGLAEAVANGLPVEVAMSQILVYKAGVLAQVSAAQADATAVTEQGLQATELFTASLAEEAVKKVESQIAGDALKLTQEQLYNAALAAAQGMANTANAAAQLSSQFGVTTQQAYGLINALQQLEVAKAKQSLGIGTAETNGRGDNILATPAQLLQQAKQLEISKQLAEVKRANAVAGADNAGKLRIENDSLSKLTKGSVEYEKQLGKVQAAERALAAEQKKKDKKGGGGGGAPKLTPNEKINTKLLDDQDKFNNKFEDAEQKHWDKVADIYASFNAKQQAQFAKNEVSKRRSRADFYAGLQDAPAGVDTQKFAAQYEEAFAKAQEIAKSGKAKLAAEFLDLRQKQIAEMQQLDADAGKVKEDQKKGDISKKDAESKLAYLEARKKLIQEAQDEEQKNLINAGDENQKALETELTAENQAYSDQADKIGTAAERAANAKIQHSVRSGIQIDAENLKLAKQAGIYAEIAKVNGGTVPKASTVAPASAASTDQKASVDVTATEPIPITSAEAMLVAQSDIFLVRDVDAINAIADMATRLETRLGEVVAAVNDAKGAITSAVSSVESAVGRIKLSAPSVVGNN